MFLTYKYICILDLTNLKVATAVVQTCQWSLCNKITFLKPSEFVGLFNKFYALCCIFYVCHVLYIL